MKQMLCALVFAGLCTTAIATPITYLFSGETTSFNFIRKSDATHLPTDPTVPLIGEDGSTIFNGNTLALGQFTFDPAALITPYTCGNHSLTYSIATEGATYSLSSGQGCMNSVTADDSMIAWHIEGPNLTHSGGFDSSIQNFAFNFSSGQFIGGTFELAYMVEGGLLGGVSGVITNLFAVPEPSALALLVAGILGLVLNRRREPAPSLA